MSISPEAKTRKRRAAGGAFKAPLTVSAPALIEDGHDRRFRKLVHDLITIAVRLETVRDMLGRRMDVSGPQYSILMAVAQNQGQRGVAVRAVADLLHVSGAFVTSEVGKLVREGLIEKQANPADRRSVMLSLTVEGEALIRQVADSVRATNDRFFGALDRDDFLLLGHIVDRMVGASRAALGYLSATAPHPPVANATGPSLSPPASPASVKDSGRSPRGRGAGALPSPSGEGGARGAPGEARREKARPPSTVRARDLRESGTKAERALWSQLRDRRLDGHKFRRQQPVGPYVVDFFCLEQKLVVEVDGGQHVPEADARRTAFLESAGCRVLRFSNDEVLGSMDGVLHVIAEHLRGVASPSRR
jgi:very-short-patch-repair endonuclease/DNA-binding MarR family transcriptional regulator